MKYQVFAGIGGGLQIIPYAITYSHASYLL